MERLVVVLGASENPNAYSHKAVQLLKKKGFKVIAVNKKTGTIGETPIQTSVENLQNVDTITLYLSPANQTMYYDWILKTRPQKVIFNPGAENLELQSLLQQNNIPYKNACSLVLLNLNQF